MKKNKIAILSVAAAMIISTSGCGNSDTLSSNESVNRESSVTNDVESENTAMGESSSEDKASEKSDKLSDDLFDFQVSVNGNIISLPCTVNDLYEAGCELDTTYMTKIYAGKKASIWFNNGGVNLSVRMYNFTENDYNLREDEIPDDVIITQMLVSEGTDEDVVEFAKGIQLNVSTEEDIIAAYGEPDISWYYCGDHYNEDLKTDKKTTALYHNDGTKRDCNYYIKIAFHDVYDGSIPTIKSVNLNSSEDIVNAFYEQFPQ